MVVRIRWNKYRMQEAPRLQNAALALASLLAPLALLAFAIGIWNLAVTLQWTHNFFISAGLFSHWESWILTAALMILFAWLLNKFANGDEAYPK